MKSFHLNYSLPKKMVRTMFSGLSRVTWTLFLERNIAVELVNSVSPTNKIQLTPCVLEWRQKSQRKIS